ncbi:MAG: zinc-dependent alcohol dehydrogenase [Promethearchaeota archaeon]|jgi:threonine dehydrogenase-like Zn-dependent dehydrogenase
MKAIVFEYSIPRLAFARIVGLFRLKGFLSRLGPLRLKSTPKPELVSKDWVIIKTKLCGICGSDHKQIFLDGNRDNPMTALISWPQILGHEAVGYIENVGLNSNLKVGDRVVLNPWLNCIPREIETPCSACQQGNYSLCRNFNKGILTPGIHTGNSSDATGGFSEYFPAHNSMAIPIPDDLKWDQALLSDPFSVAFHSVLKVKLREGSICAVYGCGNLGLLTILILKKVFKGIQVIAISRFSHQATLAKKFGADLVINSAPTNQVIEKIADYVKCDIYYLKRRKPWLIEGVDFLFDTVYSPETLETGIRFVKARKKHYKTNQLSSGVIIFTGLSSPKRYEWTPWYFKEITMIGSNAFAFETFEGKFEHAYYHYFRFLQEGRFDPLPLITHKFPLEEYKKAFITARAQNKYNSVKVCFSI